MRKSEKSFVSLGPGRLNDLLGLLHFVEFRLVELPRRTSVHAMRAVCNVRCACLPQLQVLRLKDSLPPQHFWMARTCPDSLQTAPLNYLFSSPSSSLLVLSPPASPSQSPFALSLPAADFFFFRFNSVHFIDLSFNSCHHHSQNVASLSSPPEHGSRRAISTASLVRNTASSAMYSHLHSLHDSSDWSDHHNLRSNHDHLLLRECHFGSF